jgi:hypothetical protein
VIIFSISATRRSRPALATAGGEAHQ